VIVLAGFSCAGKTTISRLLADLCGYDLMDQRQIYSRIALARGYERTRDWLSSVGGEVFVKETTLETIRRIKALPASRGVVIDASYGPAMHEQLRSGLANIRIIVVSIRAVESERAMRMAGRMNASEEAAGTELDFRDNFLKEVNLEAVLAEADIKVVNTAAPEEVARSLAEELASSGSCGS